MFVTSVGAVRVAPGESYRQGDWRESAYPRKALPPSLWVGILTEIVSCRFNRDERLVRETDLPLKSIMGLSGFGGIENMRRVFLDRTGHSPAAYRLSLRRRT